MLDEHTTSRLRSQLTRGELVLFTGAGFSTDAQDRTGRPLPNADTLAREIWELCFPGENFEAGTALSDIYEVARNSKSKQLEHLLESRLTIDPDTLPDYYRLYLETPWHAWYTLNVDDFVDAATRCFAPQRGLIPVSATESQYGHTSRPQAQQHLRVAHLNGRLPASVDTLTFSESQYSERIANQEPLYAACAAELLSRPTVFIGTVLSESLLWQHIELRKRGDRHARDLRPTSILITPHLNAARREVLRSYRVDWFPGTAKDFASDVLEPLSAARSKGFAFLKVSLAASAKAPLVSSLAAERPKLQTEYLLGAEPHWADIVQGRAVRRSHDESLREAALEIVNRPSAKTLLAVTGTAGTGKSTAMMGLAVELSNAALPVYWIDKDSMIPLSTVRRQIQEADNGVVLAIDDADLYGRSLPGLIEDILTSKERVLVVVGVRSNRLDQVIGPVERGKRLDVEIHSVPYLTDEDVDGLISVLDKHNRLGRLKGMSAVERRDAFTVHAGRQLLVAMIEATSGDKFTQKAQEEMIQLDPTRKRVYGLICLASASRHYVTKEDIILASGDNSNESLAALDQLVSRHLVYAHPPQHRIKARHRMIADLVVDKLREEGELSDVVRALSWAAASQASSEYGGQSRARRMLRRFTNHEFLMPMIGVMNTRDVYKDLEQLLTSDYHYWLQRGSLEVQSGDISLAENFLAQALSMAPHDHKVENAYGYMKIRKAWEAPESVEARGYLEEGVTILQGIIDNHGQEDAYTFHILGSQSLNWARRARLAALEKRQFLESTLGTLEKGVRLHPHNSKLGDLKKEVQKEVLSTVVRT